MILSKNKVLECKLILITNIRLRAIREKVYDLLINCIPGDMIIKYLLLDLLKKMDSDVKYELIHYASEHENKLQLGSKPIFHIEAFIAKVMLICKTYFSELMGNDM